MKTFAVFCIFGVIGDVKCTWSDSKEKVQRQSLKISKEGWIFCLTAFDCSSLGYSDNDQVSGPVEFENFINSIHVYL